MGDLGGGGDEYIDASSEQRRHLFKLIIYRTYTLYSINNF